MRDAARLLGAPVAVPYKVRPDPGPAAAIPKQDPPPVDDDVDAAPFFADLFALLDRAVSRRDFESRELTDAVTRGARGQVTLVARSTRQADVGDPDRSKRLANPRQAPGPATATGRGVCDQAGIQPARPANCRRT